MVQKQDNVKFAVHVHEQVVVADMPKIVFENESMAVALKPAGVPTMDGNDGSNNVIALVNSVHSNSNTMNQEQQQEQQQQQQTPKEGTLGGQASGNSHKRKRESQGKKSTRNHKQQQQQQQQQPRYRIVHRLDKPVGGLLLLAKGGSGKQRLMRMFEERRVRKTYVARVQDPVGSVKIR